MSSREEELLRRLDRKKIPRHIAVIMDGNGRWARQRGFPRLVGHTAGAKSVREIVRACGELGVHALTLYAFSTENWVRPAAEVKGLMKLLVRTLQREAEELERSGVRLRTIGDISALSQTVRDELGRVVGQLKDNRGLILNLALNYGGRQEILQAVRSLLRENVKQVDEDILSEHLDTAGLPDPDLLIRTSGEFRLSNFLLWQCAYTELYVTKTLWPDFRRVHLYEALLDYQTRERRFGGV
ncbi:MAG TPA: isoprenyl transferase [Elusimicrobiota bacterium]|nr:isoprenyl transferase [Elusimicrobiota bacterium]